MASKAFLYGLQEILQADVDLNGATLHARLCMANNTCATDALDGTITTMTGVTDDKSDAGGYADVALASVVCALDDVNNRVEFTAAAIEFSGLDGLATRDYEGIVIFKFVSDDDGSTPLFWIEFAAPIPKEATKVTVTPNAEGIVQFA